jgi:hypothetical protein
MVSVGGARQKHLKKQNIKWFFFESEKYPEQSVLESFFEFAFWLILPPNPTYW